MLLFFSLKTTPFNINQDYYHFRSKIQSFGGKNHVLYRLTWKISHFNNDKSRFNPILIPFQSHFNHVFADKSQKSHQTNK